MAQKPQNTNGFPNKPSLAPKDKHFLSSAPRFQGAEEGAKRMEQAQPGPGHYSMENANGWFKRSYNMNFSEM